MMHQIFSSRILKMLLFTKTPDKYYAVSPTLAKITEEKDNGITKKIT